MIRFCAFLLLVTSAACSNTFESNALRVRWEPPPGVKLVEEAGGVARFSSGVELRSVPAELSGIDAEALEELLTEALDAAKLARPAGTLSSAKAGTIPLGPVARYELKQPTSRTLVYLVPLEGRFLVLTLSAPHAEYGKIEAKLERSLSSLQERGGA